MNTQLYRFTLRFINAETERNYQSHDFPRMVSQGRFATFIAFSSYLIQGIVFDPWLFEPEVLTTIWGIRLTALMVPVSVLALSFHPLFQRINYLPLASVGLAGGGSMILLCLYLPPEKVDYYYLSLILVAFFTYTFAGTRFVYALGVDITLVLLYNLTTVWRGDFPLTTLAVHDFYIFFSNLMGGAASYLTELQRRKLFITEMKVREEMEKAQAAQHEADLANTEKSRFLAAVSHDLRQPVHAQGLFLNVLSQTRLDTKQQNIIAHIHAASSATSEMLHTLMDFSRIEAGAITPDIRAFRLQPLLNKIEAEFMPQADSKKLSYRSPETGLVAMSDPALIEIILRNLVSNAVRYTEHGGILVACRKRGDSAMLEVYDTGIGIEASQHREVFREFKQLGNPERDRRKGLGLGLSIVSGLAQALEHSLLLDSIPGRGSIFRLALPLADITAVESAPSEKDLPARKTGIRILLVDDDEAVRVGTQQQLLDWGFDCDAVESIETALDSARAAPPQLVISDYRLREHRTGAEVVTALREQVNPSLPALLITGDTAPERIQEAEALSIPLLHKPVSAKVLYRSVVEALEAE
ncbi:MAG: response regulator [Marinobacter sp.]|nr:response regulator [Marinobacter sp.]